MVILAYQQSGGGSQMATTFSGVLLLSNHCIWLNSVTQVEELLRKVQIALGEKIIHDNIQYKIRASPMDPDLLRAMLILCMDGVWDQ